MNVKFFFPIVMAVGPLAATASPLLAQPEVELTPYAGLFAPFGDTFSLTTPEQVTDPLIGEQPDTIPERSDISSHEPALGVGARLTVWLGRRFGLQGAFLYTESRLSTRTEMGGEEGSFPGRSMPAELVAITARGLVRLGAPDSRIGFRLFGGAGVLTRGGPAYADLEGTSDPSLVAGGGLRVSIAPGVALLVEVENHISWAGFEPQVVSVSRSRQGNEDSIVSPPVDDDTRIQNNLMILQAVSISLN